MAYENAGAYWFQNPPAISAPAPTNYYSGWTAEKAAAEARARAEWERRRRLAQAQAGQPPAQQTLRAPTWLEQLRMRQPWAAAPTLNQLSGQPLVSGQPFIPQLNQLSGQPLVPGDYMPRLNQTGYQAIPNLPYMNPMGQQMQAPTQYPAIGPQQLQPAQFAQYNRMANPYHRDVISSYPKVYGASTVPSLPRQPSYPYPYTGYGGYGGGGGRGKVSAWARLVGWNVNRG